MPPPEGPIAIPPEALAAVASLRSAFEHLMPEGTDFGIGVKRAAGEYVNQLALIVFVPQKLPIGELPPEQVIPPVWNEQGTEFVTDVVESRPKTIALVNESLFDSPVRGGIEIGWTERLGPGAARVHRGTLGCIVQRRGDGGRQLLTAEHVAPLGVEVSQPDPDHPQSSVIGTVVRADPVCDCSAIEPNGTRGDPLARIVEIGPVRGSAWWVELWEPVKKRGKSTGLTTGIVVAVIPDRKTLSVRCLVIDTFPFGGLFAYHGDSGSVVLNSSDEVVGLLLKMDDDTYDDAGEPVSSVGVAVGIQLVLDALDIEIWVNPPVVTRVQPDTALGVLANGGRTQIDGMGFDRNSQVTFGGVPALSVIPASPRRLIVTPPVQFLPGVTTDVVVTNGLGEQSLASPSARFTY